ncbi:MAG: S8 family serine peptidase [Actinomycetota bacterium]
MRRAVALAALLVLSFGATLARASDSGPDDPGFSKQWGLQTIHAVEAWTISRGAGITVAVVDTGVDAKHPDLAGKVLPGYNFVDNNTDASDVKGHGTHVAGIIAAWTNNDRGVASVAPDAKILPVRVLRSSGEGDPGNVAKGVLWAASHGAKVINLSLAQDEANTGIGIGDSLLHDDRVDKAIDDAAHLGATIVVAAGNSDSGGRSQTSYQASAPGVIVVGASTSKDRRAAYSNFGEGLEVVAPGGGSATDPKACSDPDWIVSTWWNPATKKSDYGGGCGTSMAVAHVSGIAALLMARGLSNVETVARIEATAVRVGATVPDQQTGFGRADAYRAVANIRSGARGTAGESGITQAAPTPATPVDQPGLSPHRQNDDFSELAATGTPHSAPSKPLPLAIASTLLLAVVYLHRRNLKRFFDRRL